MIWLKNKKKYSEKIHMRFDKSVEPEVKRACKEFVKWIGVEYGFPKELHLYIKGAIEIKASDGEYVSATCFLPFDLNEIPYAKISTGDYLQLQNRVGRDNALAGILTSIAHEITHYFQWVRRMRLSDEQMEKQAERCARYIVDRYACTREHP